MKIKSKLKVNFKDFVNLRGYTGNNDSLYVISETNNEEPLQKHNFSIHIYRLEKPYKLMHKFIYLFGGAICQEMVKILNCHILRPTILSSEAINAVGTYSGHIDHIIS